MGQAQSFNLVNFDIADLITASILCLDSSGRILFANSSAESLFGLSKSQLARLNVEDLLKSSEKFREFCSANEEESSHMIPRSRQVGRRIVIQRRDRRMCHASSDVGIVLRNRMAQQVLGMS